ncbi:transcriptional regulator [Paenibacillus sp. PK3_47]|uniref:helix-turn-helix transcriptional regulator n=1 Tax=Paenibacillus sp. PK3_47 TaxID=2072642 RepID=UPI00201E4899|nr:YafY family protein [Paenibacillus sp. PK3_47]UQZ34419.1 transcriptional regulator [Paenibacillus sp. PK3_47]
MSKSKRLLDLMMTVNRKRKFTVKELAQEFGVSSRTILRDLQELSELGVPLYSEVGPHGGYQVLNERVLPPIAFTEEEAVAIFFASHALRHYKYLPFKAESQSALHKFYHYMPGDVRDRMDEMKHRIDFVIPARQAEFPYLSILLEAAAGQKVLLIDYESSGHRSQRHIQPIGIYASNGLWYCPAYCYERKDIRVFRCDRIYSAGYDPSGLKPHDLRHVHLGNKDEYSGIKQPEEAEQIRICVDLEPEAVQACEGELWAAGLLQTFTDGSGRLEGHVPEKDLRFFAGFILGLGTGATVQEPPGLIGELKKRLAEILNKYK